MNKKIDNNLDKNADPTGEHYVGRIVPEHADISVNKRKIKSLDEDEEIKRGNELREKYLSDTKTQINGTKREIAKNLLKLKPPMNTDDIAAIVNLEIEEISYLAKQVTKAKD